MRLSIPPDAYPADHVITLGDTDYPVPADGVITDPTLTATILSSREYTDFVRSARSSDGPVQLPVSWKLAAPITVTVIPPALSDRRRDERVRLRKRHADPRLCRFLSARPNPTS